MGKFQDLTGQRFGKLTVIKRVENSKCNRTQWLCKCDCGNTTMVLSCNLKSGKVSSCGCLHREKLKFSKSKDLTGQKFGKLLVIKRGESRNNKATWLCKCDCGNTKVILASSLIQ